MTTEELNQVKDLVFDVSIEPSNDDSDSGKYGFKWEFDQIGDKSVFIKMEFE